MATWMIVRGDKLIGPATDDQIVNLINKGKLSPNTILIEQETQKKIQADQVPAFIDCFEKLREDILPDENPFADDKSKKTSKKASAINLAKGETASAAPNAEIPDYSLEADYDEFIKKRQLYTILSFAQFCCCFASPKFVIGDIQGGIIRVLLLYPMAILCFASFIIQIIEIVKLMKMTDNEFYHNFKINNKLFNI